MKAIYRRRKVYRQRRKDILVYKAQIERDEEIVRYRVITEEKEQNIQGERYIDREGKIYIKRK